jgi:hypothetical protein
VLSEYWRSPCPQPHCVLQPLLSLILTARDRIDRDTFGRDEVRVLDDKRALHDNRVSLRERKVVDRALLLLLVLVEGTRALLVSEPSILGHEGLEGITLVSDGVVMLMDCIMNANIRVCLALAWDSKVRSKVCPNVNVAQPTGLGDWG